jgi:hypothetical protein
MWKFYRSMVTVKDFWAHFERSIGCFSILVAVVLLVNQKLGQKLMNYDGVSPWWAVVPGVFFVVYHLLRGAYEAKCAAEARLALTVSERDESRRNIESLAMAHSQAIEALSVAKSTPATLRRDHRCDELEDMRKAVSHLLDRAADNIVERRATMNDWLASASRMIREVQKYRSDHSLPRSADILFEHPSGRSHRTAVLGGADPEGLRFYRMLCDVEVQLTEVIVALRGGNA